MGVGPATAAAVSAFAYGEAHPFVETNIRTAVSHHFRLLAGDGDAVLRERDILAIVDATLDRDDPRNWYYALMDYGAALKRQRIGGGLRSAGSREPYAGSRRALRAAVLRVLLGTPGATRTGVATSLEVTTTRSGRNLSNGEDPRLDEVLAALVAEGFLRLEGGRYYVGSG
jgi:A/G-specific adenine glycosylase